MSKRVMLGAVVAALVSGVALAGPLEDRVAADAVKQFHMAVENGTDTEICVHAGFVKAAMMQAGDSDGYAQWSKLERHDCSYTSDSTLRERAHEAAQHSVCLGIFDPGHDRCLKSSAKQEKIKIEEEKLYQSILDEEAYLIRCVKKSTGEHYFCD